MTIQSQIIKKRKKPAISILTLTYHNPNQLLNSKPTFNYVKNKNNKKSNKNNNSKCLSKENNKTSKSTKISLKNECKINSFQRQKILITILQIIIIKIIIT